MYEIRDNKIVKIDLIEVIDDITSESIIIEIQSINDTISNLTDKVTKLNDDLKIVIDLENQLNNKIKKKK